jgi:hypothetical protein
VVKKKFEHRFQRTGIILLVPRGQTKSLLAMLLSSLIKYATLVAAVSARVCYDETPELHCYSGENDVPQNVNVDDVTYIAAYLRSYGRQTRLGRCK